MSLEATEGTERPESWQKWPKRVTKRLESGKGSERLSRMGLTEAKKGQREVRGGQGQVRDWSERGQREARTGCRH